MSKNKIKPIRQKIDAIDHSNVKENTPLTRSKMNVDSTDKQRSILEFCSKTTEKKGI